LAISSTVFNCLRASIVATTIFCLVLDP
ncbi:putative membrane protein, partial [Chlamydia psittaci 01DC11]